MRYGILFGWGIVMYAVQFLVATILTIHPVQVPFHIAILILTLVCTSVAGGRLLGFARSADILPYSIVWLLIVIGVDAVVTFPFSGWSMYANWQLWSNYILTAIMPLLAPYTIGHKDGLTG